METLPLLKDIVVLMGVSVLMSLLLTRLGLPTVIGFLLTGVIMGPYGLGVVTEQATVDTLAQIGVVLLLFTIGLEFSLARMLSIKRESFVGGGLQVGLTVLFVTLSLVVFGRSLPLSILLGFIIAQSSTAIVLKLLVDRGEVNSPQGGLSLGISLMQDISAIIMAMVIQGMGSDDGGSFWSVAKGLGAALVVIFLMMVAASYIFPRIFYQVVKLRSREVFILTVVIACLGTAWVASSFGLSLALGAFIAGLVISESEYSDQIVAEIVPFRDIFTSLFFISIGMLLEIDFVIRNFHWLVLLVAGVFLVKGSIIAGTGLLLRYPLRTAVLAGVLIGQVGEFSFILIKIGQDHNMLSQDVYQALLAIAIVTMALTPLIYQRASRIPLGAAPALGRRGAKEAEKKAALSHHVIIVGYGLNGKNLARVLKETGIAHLIVDMNMDRVRKARAMGHKAFFGDASHPEILKKMGIEKARMVVVAISDPISTRRMVKSARELNPDVSILVRTRYIREVEDLYRLGANQVIPEEFETSVEIFARVLRDYRIPGNIIQNQIDLIREEGYAMLRTPSITGERLAKLTTILEKSVMDTFFVDNTLAAAGKTLVELDLRKKTGSTVIAVIRHGEAITNPPGNFGIEEGDILVLLGSHAQLNAAIGVLKEKRF